MMRTPLVGDAGYFATISAMLSIKVMATRAKAQQCFLLGDHSQLGSYALD